MAGDGAFHDMVDQLTRKARTEYYNPYTRFDWPGELDPDEWWMSPEFLTVHGTSLLTDERTLKALARAETLNFFSLNVHGIRELIIEVTHRIHTTRFEPYSDFLHHFLGEENEHMWFFAEFCTRYQGRLYPPLPAFPASARFSEAWNDVIVFGRIVVFEELVDYLNKNVGADRRLPAIVQDLHSAHHHDESRHVAFGKEFVKQLHRTALASGGDQSAAAREAEAYLKSYMTYSVGSLYSPRAYRDAGIGKPLDFRKAVFGHPARQEFHLASMARLNKSFVRNEIFETPWSGTHAN